MTQMNSLANLVIRWREIYPPFCISEEVQGFSISSDLTKIKHSDIIDASLIGSTNQIKLVFQPHNFLT